MIMWGVSSSNFYTSGSWMQECSGLSFHRTLTQVLVSLLTASQAFMISVFVARVKKEDEMLKREFKDWDKWASRVPYRIIPYVY
jgi:protein-S-isoprenylcysteine O-methyltransferase Ste14